MDQNWHTKSSAEIFVAFGSNESGLSDEEAVRRFGEFGSNQLPEAKGDNLALIFVRQFRSPLIYILFGAGALVYFMGEVIDASIILAVLVFNALVGTIQEGRAQNTLKALKRFSETNALVLRAERELIIPDREVVPGDTLLLHEGEKVPADARIISANSLTIDEASLTGESVPVHKNADVLHTRDIPLSDRRNMVFRGTNVLAGTGNAVTVATGIHTAIGQIAKEIVGLDAEIPLQANIRDLSRLIIFTVAGICTILFAAGLALGNSVREMFTTVVSLAVSVIPEGLPIVITLVLAAGVWRMSKRNALVRRLQAVEALGQARIIAVDKTGTLTKNEMVIQRLYVDGVIFDIGGLGYESKGEISRSGNVTRPVEHPELLFAGKIAGLLANARVMFSESERRWHVAGDPTEAAMLVFAEKVGFSKSELERDHPKIAELPFDYRTKYHATLHTDNGRELLIVSGAPEIVLDSSTSVWMGGSTHVLSKEKRDELETLYTSMLREGLRVVAFSVRQDSSKILAPEAIKDLTFVSFVGMKDALRTEVQGAMEKARAAGMKVVMVTGDHRVTAEAIGREAGIFHDGDSVLTGRDIVNISARDLASRLDRVSVFARVSPEDKLKIIQAYKERGEIIAMTGDGVNDAPSLVAADLGVAMGLTGTEVAKEAADIVLLDDNFGSIVSAVEEGRSIYKTIKKVILYLFSTSIGEVLTIGGAIALGYPLPLLPAQIIWLNFVTDGFLTVALGMEPKEEGLLRGNFERPKKYLIDGLMVQRMFVMAIPMMIGAIFLFRGYFEADLAKAWTIALTTLAVFQWFNAWNCRSEHTSLFRMNPFENMFLVGATIVVILLQLFAVYHPLGHALLRTVPLSAAEWLVIIPIAFSIIVVEEVRKFFYRRRMKLESLEYAA